MPTLSKSAVIATLADKTGLTRKAIKDFFAALEALAVKEAKNVFPLPGFGKLRLADRKARMGRNPMTGEAIKIPAKRVVKFRLTKRLKDAIVGRTPGS